MTESKLCLLSMISALGGLLFGIETGTISGVMIQIRHVFLLTPTMQEFVVTCTLLGAAIASMAAYQLLGKHVHLDSLIRHLPIVFILGAIILATASWLPMLLLGRFVQGIAVGLTCATVPTLVTAKLSRARPRTYVLMLFPLSCTFGQCVATIFAIVGNYIPKYGWRIVFGITILPATLLWIFLYLILRDAVKPQIELSQLKAPESEKLNKSQEDFDSWSLCKILSIKVSRNALIVGCALHMLQQLCGANAVMQYAATIIELSGNDDEHTSLWLSIIPSLSNFISTIVSLIIINRINRRSLLKISCIGMIISHLCLSLSFSCHHSISIDNHRVNHSLVMVHEADMPSIWPNALLDHLCANESNQLMTSTNLLIVVSMFVFLASYAIGIGALAWLINGELFEPQCRNTCLPLAAACNWICNMSVALTFLTFTSILGSSNIFLFFGIVVAAFCVFLHFTLPETRHHIESSI